MSRIFGRSADPSHPLEQQLAHAEGAGESDRLVVETWRYDWRVCAARESAVLPSLCPPGAGRGLRQAYERYYCDRIRVDAEYCSVCNGENLLPDTIKGIVLLCSAWCLDRFYDAAEAWIPDVEACGRPGWDAWLAEQIAPTGRILGEPELRRVLTQLFEAWNNWPGRDLRPTWASFWDDAAPLVSGPDWADRMREAFGLGGYVVNRPLWMVLLQYPVEAVEPCFRPTCLDAYWQPWHVLSPPDEPTGFAMDLSPAGGACCPEVIHRPIRLDVAHWKGYIGRTSAALGRYKVRPLRRRHYRLLRSRYPAAEDWLPPDS